MIAEDGLPGMWERADLEGGDPDDRSYAQRERERAANAAGADRERLGRLVRDVWTRWAAQQPDVDLHPTWLTPWNRLAARDREVDMLIGEAVAEVVRAEKADQVPLDNEERETLELALREWLDDDDATSAAQHVIGADWRPPTEVAALVAAARVETAERIAAALLAYAAEPEQSPGYDGHPLALFSTACCYEHAARLVREIR